MYNNLDFPEECTDTLDITEENRIQFAEAFVSNGGGTPDEDLTNGWKLPALANLLWPKIFYNSGKIYMLGKYYS